MKVLTSWALLTLICVGSLGCVAQSQYDKLNIAYRQSQEQIVELQARLEEAYARLQAFQNTSTSSTTNTTSTAERDRLLQRIAILEKALADTEVTIRELNQGPLPESLNNALADLASANPQLMTYDRSRGMVKLTSDLTFALGSDELSTDAATSLTKLAAIFNSPVATRYEIRVVGHTDNVPIRRAQTKAKHPTNWHLSVHRAISVMSALADAKVTESRFAVSGYGKHHPIAANTAAGNRVNRRVEIYLVAGSRRAVQQSASSVDVQPVKGTTTTTDADAHASPGTTTGTTDTDQPYINK